MTSDSDENVSAWWAMGIELRVSFYRESGSVTSIAVEAANFPFTLSGRNS